MPKIYLKDAFKTSIRLLVVPKALQSDEWLRELKNSAKKGDVVYLDSPQLYARGSQALYALIFNGF